MRYMIPVALFASLALANSCTFEQKRAAAAAEIKTIGSHSAVDAAAIPLDPLATRTFLVTPREAPGVTVPVNVGVTADTVRSELVLLATALDAGVPPNSVHYINNANGSVTVDFIQTDRFALPYAHVREIHDYNENCEIKTILGYVHSSVICPANPPISVIQELCKSIGEAKG